MPDERMAFRVLDEIRRGCGLRVGYSQEEPSDDAEQVWIVNARDDCGQTWTVRHADLYLAACELAEQVGFDLEDG